MPKKEKPRYRSRSRWNKLKSMVAGAALGLSALVGYSPDAGAETRFFSSHRALPHYRAMGGAGDLVTDKRIPANAALARSSRHISLGVRANPTSIGDSFDSLDKLVDFDYMHDDALSAEEKLEKLLNRISRFKVDLDIHASLEAYATFGEDWFGKYVAGVFGSIDYMTYMEGFKADKDSIKYDLGQSAYSRELDLIGARGLGEFISPYLDLGKETLLLDANAFVTGGAYFGYGRRFRAGKALIGVGLRGSAVYIASEPIYTIMFDKEIRGMDNIHTDSGDKRKGGGLLLDLHTTVQTNDPILNTRVGVGVTDFGVVWYDDGVQEGLSPRGALGLLVHPFHALKHDNLAVALDIEDIGTDHPVLQAGMSYAIKLKSTSIIPKLGVIVGEPDRYRGNKSNILTFGGTLKAGGLRVTAAGEYNGTKDRTLLLFGLGSDF